MKPVLTPKEANDLMRDAGDDTSLETFKRGLRQGKYPGGLYIAAEAEGQSAVYKVYALPFLAWMRDVFPLADEAIEKVEAAG